MSAACSTRSRLNGNRAFVDVGFFFVIPFLAFFQFANKRTLVRLALRAPGLGTGAFQDAAFDLPEYIDRLTAYVKLTP